MKQVTKNVFGGLALMYALILAGCGTPGTGTPTKSAVGAVGGAGAGGAIGLAAGGPVGGIVGAAAGGTAGGIAGYEWGKSDERRRHYDDNADY